MPVPPINSTLKGLPSTVKVGVNTYLLILQNELKHDGRHVHGYCCCFDKEIYLDSSTNKVNMCEVVIHELMHAIWYERGFHDFKTLSEEQTVNGLSISLTSLMMDNPKLREYFNKQWKTQ